MKRMESYAAPGRIENRISKNMINIDNIDTDHYDPGLKA